MSDGYLTVVSDGCGECEVKHSRFIAYARHVETEEAAQSFIEEIKKKHWDARHNVFAYVLRRDGIKRFSDDGEPQGTAGMPVLNVLTGNELYDCAVVVTRYFGGVLLGCGGLSRAYSQAAKLAVEDADTAELCEWNIMRLVADYSLYGKTETIIRDCGGVVISSEFGETVDLTFRIKSDMKEQFDKSLADAVNGKIAAQVIGTTIDS